LFKATNPLHTYVFIGDKNVIENRTVAALSAAKNQAPFARTTNVVRAAIFLLLFAITIPFAGSQTFKVLHEFNGQADGALPEGALLRDAAGNLFGTTFAGSPIGEGTVFKIDSTGKESVLFSFNSFVSGSTPHRR